MPAYEIIYGLLFVLIVVIKHFKGSELDRRALTMMLLGLCVLIGGNFLGIMVGLGSVPAGLTMAAIGATASGGLLAYGLYLELLAHRMPEAAPRPAAAPPRAAAAPAAAPHAAAARPVAPAARPAGPPPPRRAPPAPRDDPDGEA